MKRWTVYCHIHINSGRRYIGLTSKTMMHRWNQHCAQAKNSKGGRWHFPNAIRKYGKDAFSHEILEVCDSLESANLAEEKWIEHFNTRDPKLGFNLAKGGKHVPHPKKNPWDRPEYREKMSRIMTEINANFTHEKRVKKFKELWKDPEYSQKMMDNFARSHALVTTDRRAEITKNLWQDPKFREKISATSKQTWLDPEIRIKMSGTIRKLWQNPEFREKMSASIRQAWLNPEMRVNVSKAIRDSVKMKKKADLLSANHFRITKYGKLHMANPQESLPHSHEEVLWQCDCGKIITKAIGRVTSGHITSCGSCNVKPVEYWVNAQFGQLKMDVPQAISPGSNRKVIWKCGCGGTLDAAIFSVTSGNTIRCRSCRSRARGLANNLRKQVKNQ